MGRPVAISLSPNTEKDDVLLALKTLFRPIQWFNFRHTEKLEQEFAKMYGNGYWALGVNSGRSALYLILKMLNLEYSDKVALQAFTCIAVPNSVIWAGAQPLYIDIDKTFNLDPEDLKNKINKQVKAVIIQHAFGTPADIEKIKKIAKKHKLFLIEDCAISLGSTYKGKKTGSLGDIAFFSFGRDKIISSVFGGMIVGKDKKMYEILRDMRDGLEYPSHLWVKQQLLHPVLFSLILPLYNVGYQKFTIGKTLLYLFQKIRLLSKPVYKEEEHGLKPKYFPRKMPGALSLLALNQLKKLPRYNKHRKDIAQKYFNRLNKKKVVLPVNNKNAVWLRFPVLTKDSEIIFNKAKKKGILLGNWYKGVIVPAKDMYKINYSKGACPNAEKYSKEILNLPTYPTLTKRQLESVIEIINE